VQGRYVGQEHDRRFHDACHSVLFGTQSREVRGNARERVGAGVMKKRTDSCKELGGSDKKWQAE